jgi:uncharacterized protein YdeI (YjbR/CyaY-like superfamily)
MSAFATIHRKHKDKMKIIFFRSASQMHGWLEQHFDSAPELWVGFHKKDSGKPSITWPESVDEALCVGWIDGIRKGIDATSYTIRFSPRKPTGTWSAANIKKVQVLAKQGRMQPAGLKAFQARKVNKSGIYSYEQRSHKLPKLYERLLRKNKNAWEFFSAQPASYQKAASWWVVSAKLEKTKLDRVARLIEDSSHGRRIQPLTRKKASLQ